jgi:hypothetical protein
MNIKYKKNINKALGWHKKNTNKALEASLEGFSHLGLFLSKQ